MKIICDKQALVTALARARSIGSGKTPMPILSSALLRKAGNGHLFIAATDLEISYSTSVSALVEGDDPVAINAGDLLDRVKAMPDGDVQLNATAKSVVVTAKGSKRRFERAAISGAEFPSLPTEDKGPGFEAPAALLATMLEAVHFAVNQDVTSSTSNMLVKWSPGKLVMAATNGHRLSVEERTVDGIDNTNQTLIPFRAVGELRKLLEHDGRVVFAASERATFLDFGEFRFSCRRPDATFPPYESFVPKRIDSPVRIPVKQALESLAAVSLAAGRNDATSNLLLSFKDGAGGLSAESADKGSASDGLDLEWNGKPFELCFQGHYVRDALAALGSTDAALSFDPGNELGPMRFDPWDEQTGRSHYGIVMPTRKA